MWNIYKYFEVRQRKKTKLREMSKLPVEISILMNYECNYSCQYCFATKPGDKSQYRQFNGKQWSDQLDKIYTKYGKCRVVLSGGEPLLYPDASDAVVNMTKSHFVNLGTNLHVGHSIINKFIDEVDPKNISFSTSFHPGMANLEDFVEKVITIKNSGFDICTSIVLYPPLLSNIEEINSKFVENQLLIYYFPFIGEYEGKKFPQEYTDSEVSTCKKLSPNWFSKPPSDILPKRIGKNCFAGVKTISVFPNGDVKRCIGNSKIMGNFFESDFELFSDPQPCELEVCDCQMYHKYHADY